MPIRYFGSRPLAIVTLTTLLLVAATAGLAHAQTVNRDDVLYILPFWGGYAGASHAALQAEIADVRSRLGPEGPYVKFGFTTYIDIPMDDWNVDTSNPAAIRALLAPMISQIDAYVDKARANNIPISLMFLTAIRSKYDPVQRASESEDVRSMQWYADNVLASGWWTHSRYSRHARPVQEAYIRELGKIVANRMRLYPDTLVAATGDGEVELALPAAGREGIYADYSPFVVAEFRDWLRRGGLYATGATYAGQGYSLGARYASDATPGQDTNGDGHTLNGDFGTSFQTWDLLHFNWNLDDAYLSGDPRAIPLATYSGAGFNRLPGEVDGGFDAPRVPQNVGASAWWDLWVLFKQTLLQHHNTDFAKWMTTSPDPATGATIPRSRWYSDQIPADYMFNGSPANPTDRFKSSASSYWSADISPYGSLGVTAFNIDFPGVWVDGTWVPPWIAYTLKNVAPQIASRDVRWGIIEWHPGVLPYDTGVSTNLELFRAEMSIVEQYRPSLLQPFAWGLANSEVKGNAFETALREMVARIKDGTPPNPLLELEAPASGARAIQPFALTGWAVDLGKIRGPGRGPGIDQVDVYAYPNPGSGTAPVFVGSATYGIARGDKATAYGTQFTNSGFSLTVPYLPPGRYDLVAFGRSTVSESFNVSKTVTVDVFSSITPSPVSLKFGATKAGASGAVVAQTPPQSVTLAYGGPGSPAWTATADQTWVQLTNASGSGPGQFTVSIANPANVIGGRTSLTATITIASTTAGIASSTVGVTLTVDQSGGATAPPFGMVDSPVQNAAGVVGSIGITGWALDDVGVRTVTLYRNCLSFEPAANCAMVGGYNLVYMGVADMVAGARPDVEAAYPGYPQASRAGWGYLLLTNMLPHIPTEQMFGGQGTLSIYVFATDVEGHMRLLGRSAGDQTPSTITLANDTTGKPFGAIDSPGQGQTVSGMVNSWGWALTPDAKTTEGGGIVVPTNGSTIWVWIDGVPAPVSAYNLCRGTSPALNPTVPVGLYCDDDVANIFGNATPQPMFQPRTSNDSKYRNLDAGRGAIGVYTFDTRALTNGRHSIVWGVTDSAGRVDGIGSRDFIVLNSGASDVGRVFPALSAVEGRPGVSSSDVGRGFSPGRHAGPEGPAYVPSGVTARTGFDLFAPLDVLPADAAGVRHVRLLPQDRLELWLGAVDGGYHVANGTLRDLPPGSRLDPAVGLFTWTPGAAYFGTYRLAFVRGSEQIVVDVTIRPVEVFTQGEAAIRMHVEAPTDGEAVSGSFTVAGWALDPQASIGSGISAVHVWAQRRDQPGAWPAFLGEAALGGARPDVAAAFGPQFGSAGFSLTTGSLEPGQCDITAYVWNRRTARWEDARTVRVITSTGAPVEPGGLPR